MKISRKFLLLVAGLSAVVFFNSCSKDSEDTSDNPWADATHQVHASDGYSIMFPANIFGQYHHNKEKDLIGSKDVEWNDIVNVFCLKADSACNITVASTKNSMTEKVFGEYEPFEMEIISAPNNFNKEPDSEIVYFASLDKNVTGHFFSFENERDMQFYYIHNPLNNRGYRLVVQAPASNKEFWEYVPEILASFRFTGE